MYTRNINIILIILIFWTLLWAGYNFIIRPHYDNPLLDDPLTRYSIDLPPSLKCYIKEVSSRPENNVCDKENLDGWSLGHFAIYFTIGLFVPNAYFWVFLISVICEVWEYIKGWRARWFLDPIVNLLGYTAGTLVGPVRFPIAISESLVGTFGLGAFLYILLNLNKPDLVYRVVV